MTEIKCSVKSINELHQILLDQMEDDNGRGEFDRESDLLGACERVIEWMEEERREGKSLKTNTDYTIARIMEDDE